jgi:hypothetical protein
MADTQRFAVNKVKAKGQVDKEELLGNAEGADQ